MTDNLIHVGQVLTSEQRAEHNAKTIKWWEEHAEFWRKHLAANPTDAASREGLRCAERELRFLKTGQFK